MLGLGSLFPPLFRDWVHGCHICTGSALTLPHLHRALGLRPAPPRPGSVYRRRVQVNATAVLTSERAREAMRQASLFTLLVRRFALRARSAFAPACARVPGVADPVRWDGASARGNRARGCKRPEVSRYGRGRSCITLFGLSAPFCAVKYLLQTSKALSSVEAKLAVKQGLHTASMLAELLKDEHMPRVGRALEEAAEAVNRAQGWDAMAWHGTARHGTARHGTARPGRGWAQQGVASHCTA